MRFQDLPEELMEQIFGFIVSCPQHPRALRASPCPQWHYPMRIHDIAPLRLVSMDFCNRLTPPMVEHVSSKGLQRHTYLPQLSASRVATQVRTLRIDISPRDWGRDWSNKIHGYPPSERPLAYFDDLREFLLPVLSGLPEVRTMYLTTTYSGLHLARIGRGDLMLPCFQTLRRIIRDARMTHLEVLQIGLPYEGGYAGFFKDQGNKKLLENISDSISQASVKLSDWQDNYTIMPIPLGLEDP